MLTRSYVKDYDVALEMKYGQHLGQRPEVWARVESGDGAETEAVLSLYTAQFLLTVYYSGRSYKL